jgi:hypothetical protein
MGKVKECGAGNQFFFGQNGIDIVVSRHDGWMACLLGNKLILILVLDEGEDYVTARGFDLCSVVQSLSIKKYREEGVNKGSCFFCVQLKQGK